MASLFITCIVSMADVIRQLALECGHRMLYSFGYKASRSTFQREDGIEGHGFPPAETQGACVTEEIWVITFIKEFIL